MINYNDRHFRSVENGAAGDVDSDTRFHYRQEGDVVWATYGGGGVAFGTLTAVVLADGRLDMRYQQVSKTGTIKTGRCLSAPEVLPDGRLRLHESWRWTEGGEGSGESTIEEVPPPPHAAADIDGLVQAELNRMDDQLVAAVRPLLIAPRMEKREWDYGPRGQTYACWIVLEHPASNTGIAYCAQGFGPRSPWGLMFLRGEPLSSMGMDSGWYSSLEGAFRESRAWDLPSPPGYEVE